MAIRLDKQKLLAQYVYPAGAPTNLWVCDAYLPNASGEEYAGRRYLLEFGDESIRFDDVFEKWAYERFNQIGKERSAQLKALGELLAAGEMALALVEDMSRFAGLMALRDYALFNDAPIALRQAIDKAKEALDR